ncbi:MAG: D-alanyl-D-alanine carboxypeptidase/D-alanyl-D-alanine endopeptidase, partial [Pyrinomonadaceae bacterium]
MIKLDECPARCSTRDMQIKFRQPSLRFLIYKLLTGKLLALTTISLIIFGTTIESIEWPVSAGNQQSSQREHSAPVERKKSTSQQSPAAAISHNQSKAGGPKTLEQLRAKIREELSQPEVASAIFAVKIVSLDSNRVLYEENSRKMLVPASNMKIYTSAAAIDRLTPNYKFTTTVYAASSPNTNGVVQGEMIVYGRGDPTFAPRFYDGDYYKGIDALADRIAGAGVKRIEGDLVGDETYFNGPSLGAGWEWDDLQWYYGAEVSALTINDNAVDLFLKPGSSPGLPASIDFKPMTSFVKIINHTTTTAHGTRRELVVNRPLGSGEIEVSGGVPIDDPGLTTGNGFVGAVAVLKPALMFTTMLREALERRGVKIKGDTRTVEALTQQIPPSPSMRGLIEITNIQSPPLSAIVTQTLKI